MTGLKFDRVGPPRGWRACAKVVGALIAPLRAIHPLAQRFAVVVAGLAILYVRTPITFYAPQMWGEDIDFFYLATRDGWSSLTFPLSGYLAVTQFLTAILTSYASPVFAASIYCYTAILLTLLVMWIVTSPRLDMPAKPLLALAIVVVPMGYEELGTITNIQWILPIGAFALLFMRPSPFKVLLLLEAIFIAMMSVSGPFSIFLVPLFVWRGIESSGNARRRLLMLGAVNAIGATIQIMAMVSHPVPPLEAIRYSWTLWFDLPFSRIMTTFGPASGLFRGVEGVIFASVLLAVAIALAFLRPYRTQKAAMIFFAACVAVGGMLKFRAQLETQLPITRYFYPGSIFALWFICCLSDSRKARTVLTAFVAFTELQLIVVTAATPRDAEDRHWPVWAKQIQSGLPVTIPTGPDGFYVDMPSDPAGPLVRFASWIGRDVASLPAKIDPSFCSESLDGVTPLPGIHLAELLDKPKSRLWLAHGSIPDAKENREAPPIALIADDGRVMGFATQGFSTGAKWKMIFKSAPDHAVRAMAVMDEGVRLCPLSGLRYLADDRPPGQFVGPAAIVPGAAISQRLSFAHALTRLSVTFVTWGRAPSDYAVRWNVKAYIGERTEEIGAGTIQASSISDWQEVDLPLKSWPVKNPDKVEVSFLTDSKSLPAAPIGVPLFKPIDGAVAGQTNATGVQIAGRLWLREEY
jgi:hypothetical protein